MSKKDFRTDHLNDEQKRIAHAIINLITEKNGKSPSGGGCTAFYTPEQWKDRGEAYGINSVLLLVHDGGDLAPFCNFDYGQYDKIDCLTLTLEMLGDGYWMESCGCWYTAVYRKGEDEGTKRVRYSDWEVETEFCDGTPRGKTRVCAGSASRAIAKVEEEGIIVVGVHRIKTERNRNVSGS